MRRLILVTGNWLLVTLLLSSLIGCGYTTTSLLPPELDSIHVDNFLNKIDPASEVSNRRPTYSYRPGLEIDITRAVIDGFILERQLDIKSEANATLLLKGELMDLRQFPLSYDGDENVEEFRVELLVDIELYDNLTGKLMWEENRFMGQSSYSLTGPNAKTESQALKAAVKDLAQRIVERTVEAW